MRRLAYVVLLVALCLAGCATQDADQTMSGQTLSREEQQSLYEQRLEQQDEPTVVTKGTVYWSKNGSKYHKDPECSYLKNAKEVQSGTATQAANYGADSPCSRCAGG